MTYKIHASPFINGFGIGIVVVDGPVVSGDTFTVQCHSFFSQRGNTYKRSTLSYDSDVLKGVGDGQLLDLARDSGVERLLEVLDTAKNLHYQFMLKHGGPEFKEQEDNFLMQLHMRLRIDTFLETEMQKHALSQEFKSMINLVVLAPRIFRSHWS